MTRRPFDRHERASRLELLRARAALERLSLTRSVREVGASLTPASLLREAVATVGGRGRSVDWLLSGLGLMRRYPFLVSSASALLSGKGSRRWVKILAAGLVAWKLARGRAAGGESAKD